MTQDNQPLSTPPALHLLYDLIERCKRGEEEMRNDAGFIECIGQDFSDADLTDEDLSHFNFTNCNFSRTDCRGTIFDECILTWCDFGGANLTHASLQRVRAWAANFSNADCQHMDASSGEFQGSTFANTDIRYTNFRSADLTKCRFLRNLDAAVYTNAYMTNFAGADLSDADMRNMMLRECNLTGAKLYCTSLDDTVDISAADPRYKPMRGERDEEDIP